MSAGWTEVALGDVVSIDRRTIEPRQIETGTRYVALEDIQPGGLLDAGRRVEDGSVSSAKLLFTEKHVLYGKLRPNLAKVARPDFAGVCSTEILPLAPGPYIERHFLVHFLLLPATVALATRRAAGANLPRLSPSELERFRVPLPPLVEQRRIARVLDAASDLVRARERTAAVLESLKRATIENEFRRPRPVAPIGEILDRLTSGSRGWAKYYSDAGDPFLRVQNVRYDELVLDDVATVVPPPSKEADRTRVGPGDVVLSITADLGRTGVVPDALGSAYINQHLAVLRSREYNSRYLSAGLSSSAGQAQLLRRNRQGVKAGLNFDDIGSVLLPRPPRREQDDLAASLDGIDRATAVAHGHLAGLTALLGSVRQRAFETGT